MTRGKRQPPAGHVAILGHLVGDLVHAAQGKIAIQNLHDGSETRDRGAQCTSDHGILGYGGVADPLGAEYAAQALACSVAAPGLHALTHEEHAVVPLHLFPDAAGNDSSIIHIFHEMHLSLCVRKYIPQCPFRRHIGTASCECNRFVDHAGAVIFYLLQLCFGDPLLFDQARLRLFYRTFLFPGGNFFFGAVSESLGGVGLAMAMESVGLALDHHGALSAPGPLHRLGCYLVNGGNIHAVHSISGDTVTGGTGIKVLDGGVTRDGDRFLEEIVFADEQQRQLPDPGQVHGLVPHAAVGRPVAEEASGHLTGAAIFRGKGRSAGDGQIGPDDAVGPEHAHVGVDHMHGPSLASVASGLFFHEFGQHGLHVSPFGEVMAFAPMRAEDIVIAVQRGTDTGCHRLLSRGEVVQSLHARTV